MNNSTANNSADSPTNPSPFTARAETPTSTRCTLKDRTLRTQTDDSNPTRCCTHHKHHRTHIGQVTRMLKNLNINGLKGMIIVDNYKVFLMSSKNHFIFLVEETQKNKFLLVV